MLASEHGHRELDELAEKGSLAVKSTKDRLARRQEAWHTKQRLSSNRLLRRSLGLPRALYTAILLLVTFGFVGVLMLAIVAFSGDGPPLLLAPAGLLAAVCAMVLYWAAIVYPDNQLMRLQEFPFEFDAEAYLQVLGERHYGRRLQMTVTFQHDLDADLAEKLPLVVAGAMRGARGKMLNNSTLLITGKTVRTWFLPGRRSATASTKPIHDNSNLHRQFNLALSRCLKPISKVAPVQRVVVRGPAGEPPSPS